MLSALLCEENSSKDLGSLPHGYAFAFTVFAVRCLPTLLIVSPLSLLCVRMWLVLSAVLCGENSSRDLGSLPHGFAFG